jgi:hypothetical protein
VHRIERLAHQVVDLREHLARPSLRSERARLFDLAVAESHDLDLGDAMEMAQVDRRDATATDQSDAKGAYRR